MAKRKFRTMWDDPTKEFPGEIYPAAQPSLTMPDQSMTIRQLVMQHAYGLPFDVLGIPTFDNEENILDPLGGRDLKSLDIAEIEALARDARAKIMEAKRKHDEIDKARRDAAKKEAAEQRRKDKMLEKLAKQGKIEDIEDEFDDDDPGDRRK